MRKHGKVVELNDGRRGYTYNKDGFINGKVPVYLYKNFKLTGEKILVKPDKLKLIGYID